MEKLLCYLPILKSFVTPLSFKIFWDSRIEYFTWDSRGARECKSGRSRKVLKNAFTLAISEAFDTAEHEPEKVSRKWGVPEWERQG